MASNSPINFNPTPVILRGIDFVQALADIMPGSERSSPNDLLRLAVRYTLFKTGPSLRQAAYEVDLTKAWKRNDNSVDPPPPPPRLPNSSEVMVYIFSVLN